MAPSLFAAELTARHGHDPAEHYRGLCDAFGEVFFDRVEAPADARQKKLLGKLSPGQLKAEKLAGATIREVLDKAPGNDAPRSEEHTSELQSLMRRSYAVFCLKKKKTQRADTRNTSHTTQIRQRYN